MNSLHPRAVAQNLTSTADECCANQPALRARLLQAADVINQQQDYIDGLLTSTGVDMPSLLRKQAS